MLSELQMVQMEGVFDQQTENYQVRAAEYFLPLLQRSQPNYSGTALSLRLSLLQTDE
jgi:hypothetical protein